MLTANQLDGHSTDVSKLEALRRFSEAVADSSVLEEILGTLVIHGMEALDAQRGAILRLRRDKVEVLVSREAGLITWGGGLHVSESLVHFALESGQAYVQVQASTESADGSSGTRALICLPMETEPDYMLFYADRPGDRSSFDIGAVWVLQSLVQFGRVAMSNARMIEQAHARNEMLQTLNRTSLLVSSSLDIDQILSHLLDQVLRLTGGELALVLGLRDGRMEVLEASGQDAETPFYSRAAVERVVTSGLPWCIADAENAEGLSCFVSMATLKLKSIMCVPLAVHDDLLGVLYVSSRLAVRTFSDTDLGMLQAMGAHAALAIHNARQFVLVQEKSNIEAELAIAHTIQQSFFPKQMPEIAGLWVAGACEAAKEVGGDYYDIIPLDNGQVALTLGDVSGKSISASLYMAVVRTALRMALRYGHSPRECLLEVNSRIHADIKDGSFITCFLGVYDPATMRFSYASAGQHLSFLKSGAKARLLEASGLPLGFDPDVFASRLGSYELTLSPGDRVVLLTDGVIEALNEEQEEFGEERLMKSLQACRRSTVERAVARVFDTIRTHVGQASPWDDMTLLIAEVKR